MKCLFPVRIYRGDNGIVSHVEYKLNSVKDAFWRPCQICINCRLRRAESNAIRMVHESKFHEQSCFLTLTYDRTHCPPNNSLRYDDVAKFIKRLRHTLDYPNISYYRVGEYGSDFSRPHYHMVLFGYDFKSPHTYLGTPNTVKRSGQKGDRVYYKSSFATDCWGNGFVDIGSVNFSTAMYTSKYVTKKLYGSQASAYGDLLPERSSSSKLRPIGLSWIQKYFSDVYPHDYVLLDGKKLQPPRFYDEWLSKNKPSLYSEVKRRREDSNISDAPDWYDLHSKHVIRIQKQSKFLRDGCAPNLFQDEELTRRKLDYLTAIRKGISHES